MDRSRAGEELLLFFYEINLYDAVKEKISPGNFSPAFLLIGQIRMQIRGLLLLLLDDFVSVVEPEPELLA